MSLMRLTTGQMCDRVAVLRLKIEHGSKAGKDVAHFEAEIQEIMAALTARPMPAAVLLGELYEVNAAIWRLIETSPPELLRLNARRAAIREEIDKAAGEYRGPEKV